MGCWPYYLIYLLLATAPVGAQLLQNKPVSTGGEPVGSWKGELVPIQVYAAPELLAAVSNLQFTGTITGSLVLDAQGGFESDYITTSTASLSIVILGAPLPISLAVADTNRAKGTYQMISEVLVLTPETPGVSPDTLFFSVMGDTLRLVQTVPLGEYAATVATLAPGAGPPLAVFDLVKPAPAFQGPITADFNDNGAVDFNDFIAFAQQFGKSTGSAGYDPKFDLNKNGSVDFGDFVSFAQQFGLKK
ncbi:MAG: hypothetical protein O3B73_15635 [bacterium]|nr:hypothetical protein [bacterium]